MVKFDKKLVEGASVVVKDYKGTLLRNVKINKKYKIYKLECSRLFYTEVGICRHRECAHLNGGDWEVVESPSIDFSDDFYVKIEDKSELVLFKEIIEPLGLFFNEGSIYNTLDLSTRGNIYLKISRGNPVTVETEVEDGVFIFKTLEELKLCIQK